MKSIFGISLAAALLAVSPLFTPSASAAEPYRLVSTTKVGGDGGFDYVFADADARHLYIPRGNRVTVFDLDTLKPASDIPNTARVHGVAVDSKSHHAFSSSNPVVMWDTRTLQTIKTIDVEGSPDGILFDRATERVFILSHSEPNLTAIDAKDGTVVGTVNIDGAPEEGASDGNGHLYVDVEDKANVAVVDSKNLTCTGHYALGDKGSQPAGLALDAKNRIIFCYCRTPGVAVILNADDGTILASLPTGKGVDAAEFNPDTLEAFSSQGDGTLTVIKENSPTDFVVEQTVQTKAGARTSTLDSKTGKIFLITGEYGRPGSATPATTGEAPRKGKGKGGRPPMIPGSFSILTVSR